MCLYLFHALQLSISCSQSLYKVVSTVDPLVFLLLLGAKRARYCLNMALEVGIAEVSKNESGSDHLEATNLILTLCCSEADIRRLPGEAVRRLCVSCS